VGSLLRCSAASSGIADEFARLRPSAHVLVDKTDSRVADSIVLNESAVHDVSGIEASLIGNRAWAGLAA
jgi:hypothetical protein